MITNDYDLHVIIKWSAERRRLVTKHGLRRFLADQAARTAEVLAVDGVPIAARPLLVAAGRDA